jgi:NAD(P)-dependent dehydrogenase (short-subunit alcohol dehydrogenase family)
MGTPAMPFEELSLAQWQAVVSTNLTAAFLCTQHAFRIMKDQTPRGGRIINNGSISAHAPRPFSAPYTSTKHAITGLTKATNLDGRAYDIAVGQLDIGNAATPMTDRMVDGVLQPDGRKMPEPRMDSKAVGDAVAYMAGLPLDAGMRGSLHKFGARRIREESPSPDRYAIDLSPQAGRGKKEPTPVSPHRAALGTASSTITQPRR